MAVESQSLESRPSEDGVVRESELLVGDGRGSDHHRPTTPLHLELRSRVVRGLAWNVATSGLVQLSRFLFGLLLARLLTPAEYGIAGMALVFSALALTLSDLALGVGLVQRQRITEADRSTVFWASFGLGALLTVAGVALAGPIAGFFGEPAVEPLFMVLSLSFVLTGLGRVPASLFHREMNFRAISIRIIAATLLSGVVGVVLAAKGYGPWALVAQSVTMTFVSTALLWAFCPWRPRFLFSRASLSDLGGFGLKVAGSRVVDYLSTYSDRLLIGRVLGSASLGTYSVATTIVFFPLNSFSVAVVDTLFPALSRIQDDLQRASSVWLRATRFATALVLPAMLGLVVIAPDFVRVVLGERWEAAIPVLQLLALTAVVLALSGLGLTVLTALGRANTVLGFSLFELLVLVLSVAVGLRWGVVGVAGCHLVGTTIARLILMHITIRAFDTSFLEVVRALSGVVQAALVMAASVWALTLGLADLGVPAAGRLISAIGLGIVLYVPLCAWRSPEMLVELRTLRGRRLPARP
jgi:O-antigen/teichoic acid export membrane protein